MSLLEFQSATKMYGSRTVVDGLTLYVGAGEIYGFLGQNGAGKTTALHLAMGFLRLTSGAGRVAGRPFGSKAARTTVGFVPDAPAFLGGTAIYAMELAGTLSNLPRRGLRARCQELLRQLDLPEDGLDVRKFSRGQQQRLSLAQAMVHRPRVLLLDEPTSALDPPSVLSVRALLAQARDEGTAIFFSSHQLSEVEQLSDRIGFLRDGRLMRTGRLSELLAEQANVEIVIRGLDPGSALALRWKARVLNSDGTRLIFAVPLARQKEVIEAVWLAGGELVSVGRMRESLEDLFQTLQRSAWPIESRAPADYTA